MSRTSFGHTPSGKRDEPPMGAHVEIRTFTPTWRLVRVRFFGAPMRLAEGQSIPVIREVEWQAIGHPGPPSAIVIAQEATLGAEGSAVYRAACGRS